MSYRSDEISQTGNFHIIGNGSIYVCGDGPDIWSVQSPYVSPVFCSIQYMPPEHQYECRSLRQKEKNIWEHKISYSGNLLYGGENAVASVVITDVADAEKAVFYRRVRALKPVHFKLVLPDYVKCKLDTLNSETNAPCTLLTLIIPKGTGYLDCDCTLCEYRMVLVLQGCVTLDLEEREIVFRSGKSLLGFAANDNMTELKKLIRRLLRFSRDDRFDDAVIKKSEDFSDIPAYIRGAYMSLCSHMSSEGGVIASHIDPLCYPDVQYTATKVFMAVGHKERAMAAALFWYNKWKRNNDIYFAESTGDVRHKSIFDESVTPSLVIKGIIEIQSDKLITETIDMLMYMQKNQMSVLRGGMMPFGGRRNTYDRLIPPNQGSSFATVMFIDSTGKLISAMERLGIPIPPEYHRSFERALSLFSENFIEKGKIIKNAPKRETKIKREKNKYGECVICREHKTSWLTVDANGFYLCDKCINEKLSIGTDYFEKQNGVMTLPVMMFSGLDFVSRLTSSQILHEYISTMKYGTFEGWILGMMTIASIKCECPALKQIYDQMINLRDSAGAWSKEYNTLKPSADRAHSLSCASNILAAVYYNKNI